MASTPRGWWEVFLRSGIALPLATAIAALTPSFAAAAATKKGQSRDELGSVEITAPGTYTVTAGPEFPDAVESQILLGS